VREWLPIVAFGMAGYAATSLLDLRETIRYVAIAVLNARLIVRAALSVVRLLLDPAATGLRLVRRFDDEDSAYVYVWARRLVALPVYGYFAIEAGDLVGLPADLRAPLVTLIGLYLTGLLVVLVLQSRRAVADWLAGNGREGARRPGLLRRLAGIWHLVAIFYLVAVFGVTSFGAGADAGLLVRATVVSLLVIMLFRSVNDGAHRLLAAALRIPAELNERFPTLQERARRYEQLLRRIATGALAVVALSIALQGWGVDVGAAVTSDTGQALISRALLLLFIVGGAFLVWEGFSVVIESVLAEREPDGTPRERSARLLTLLPLLMNTVRLVLTLLLVLTVLSELGVDIGPLLAGAGVLGIAVGFGAQSLVRDVITGVFILLEETITIGDIVTLGAHTGVVEKMTIRTIRLRDISGNVHTLPYGEVSTILNYSEDYAYALLDVGVAYRENTDEVVEVLKGVAEELAADAAFAPDLSGGFEVMGVDALADSSVTIRVRQRTRPGMQWRIKRELLRRIKLRFDELGIEIPFPHTTLYFGADKDGRAAPAQVLLGKAPGTD
jgi:small conductance mechanosensitive channel